MSTPFYFEVLIYYWAQIRAIGTEKSLLHTGSRCGPKSTVCFPVIYAILNHT